MKFKVFSEIWNCRLQIYKEVHAKRCLIIFILPLIRYSQLYRIYMRHWSQFAEFPVFQILQSQIRNLLFTIGLKNTPHVEISAVAYKRILGSTVSWPAIHIIRQYTEAETKWLPFCQQHFQAYFLQWKSMYFDKTFQYHIKSKLSLVQMTTWHQSGDKPLS